MGDVGELLMSFLRCERLANPLNLPLVVVEMSDEEFDRLAGIHRPAEGVAKDREGLVSGLDGVEGLLHAPACPLPPFQ